MPNLQDITSARQQVVEEVTEWFPDVPAFQSPGMPILVNAYPRDNGLYGPARGLEVESQNTLLDLVATLSSVNGDLASMRRASDNDPFYYVAGFDESNQETSLFEYEESTETWTDVSPSGGAISSSRSAYARFVQFGTAVYATIGRQDQLYKKTIGGGGNFALVTDSPQMNDIAIVRDFLVGINTTDGRTRVEWSAIGDPDNWEDPDADPIAAGIVLRGYVDLNGGGQLQRIIPGVGGADATIIAERRIWRMVFVGAQAIGGLIIPWEFQIVEQDKGTNIPNAVVSDGSFIFYFGMNRWFAFNGANSTPIGAGKVDRTFSTREGAYGFNPSQLQGFQRGLVSSIAEQEQNVLWAYRGSTEETVVPLQADDDSFLFSDDDLPLEGVITSDFNTVILAFNQSTGKWGNAVIAVQALGRVDTDKTGTDAPRLVAIGNDFALSTLTGDILPFEIVLPERNGTAFQRATVRRVWPLTNAPSAKVSMVHRDSLASAKTTTTPLARESDDAGTPHESARYASMRVTTDTAEEWDYMLGVGVEFQDWGLGGNG